MIRINLEGMKTHGIGINMIDLEKSDELNKKIEDEVEIISNRFVEIFKDTECMRLSPLQYKYSIIKTTLIKLVIDGKITEEDIYFLRKGYDRTTI